MTLPGTPPWYFHNKHFREPQQGDNPTQPALKKDIKTFIRETLQNASIPNEYLVEIWFGVDGSFKKNMGCPASGGSATSSENYYLWTVETSMNVYITLATEHDYCPPTATLFAELGDWGVDAT